MKKFICFCVIWNYLFFNLNGSQVDSMLSNLNIFSEVCEKQQNEFYDRMLLNTADSDESTYTNLLVGIEIQELTEDIKAWFDVQLSVLLHLHDPMDYEIYKKALKEDLEWYEMIYPEMAIVNFLEGLKHILQSC